MKKSGQDDLVDDDQNLQIQREQRGSIAAITSPRSKFIKKKFKTYEEDEIVLENYACAANFTLLLQGMLYITNKNVYFYSPFNKKTMLGRGTKIKMSYDAIELIKKESAILVFPNSIRFILKNKEEMLFTSFVSRDTCFALLTKQLDSASAAILSKKRTKTKDQKISSRPSPRTDIKITQAPVQMPELRLDKDNNEQ